jgi:hypothetical protein
LSSLEIGKERATIRYERRSEIGLISDLTGIRPSSDRPFYGDYLP